MWVVDYVEDIESDLSVFHRVDDPMSLPAPVYFARAERLAAYPGVIRARVLEEQQRQGGNGASASSPGGRTTMTDTAALDLLAAEGWVEHTTESESDAA